MAIDPIPLDTTFTAPIGLQVKGETWSCIEVPGSAELFGTRKGVRADVVIDGIPLPNVGLLVTGTGGHMLSVSAALRRRLGKELGDAVTVRLERRLT